MYSRLKRMSPPGGLTGLKFTPSPLTGGFLIFIFWLSLPPTNSQKEFEVNCGELRLGQYRCQLNIDPNTQQPFGCNIDNTAKIECEAVEGLICRETESNNFFKDIPCKFTNGYSYSTTLLLSVFFGFLGADRFYLGHFGMGALKFCTFGFLLLGHLLDIILIATENILPADGSNYIISYYGPGVQTIRSDNLTYIIRKSDWF